MDEANQKSKVCLKSLAPNTMNVIRKLQRTTPEVIANIIIQQLTNEHPNMNGQETIRRRIYDVINVLSAAGVIDKVGKQIIYQGTSRYFNTLPTPHPYLKDEDSQRIRKKEKQLEEKIVLLTLFKSLIQRNYPIAEPPQGSKPLPQIIIGINEQSSMNLKYPQSRSELELSTKHKMIFLAPSDMLKRLHFPKTSIKAFLEASPDYARYAQSLLE